MAFKGRTVGGLQRPTTAAPPAQSLQQQTGVNIFEGWKAARPKTAKTPNPSGSLGAAKSAWESKTNQTEKENATPAKKPNVKLDEFDLKATEIVGQKITKVNLAETDKTDSMDEILLNRNHQKGTPDSVLPSQDDERDSLDQLLLNRNRPIKRFCV